jgi:hypothetical protein
MIVITDRPGTVAGMTETNNRVFQHRRSLDPATEASVARAVAIAQELPEVAGADLLAVAGSYAYGLAHADSDVDVRGVYRAPLDELLGLDGPPQRPVSLTKPDTVVYELGVFVRLALAANPNVLELLGLDVYERTSAAGVFLLEHASLFFSQRARMTYGGFATSQAKEAKSHFARLAAGDRSVERRARKHLQHTFRVLEQGLLLLSEGVLQVRLPEPGRVAAYGDLSWDEAQTKFEHLLARLDTVSSPLPVQPDRGAVNELLLQLRQTDPDT